MNKEDKLNERRAREICKRVLSDQTDLSAKFIADGRLTSTGSFDSKAIIRRTGNVEKRIEHAREALSDFTTLLDHSKR